MKSKKKKKNSEIAHTTLKKNKFGGWKFPEFKTYYKVTLIRTVWYWWKNSQINQWNRMESRYNHRKMVNLSLTKKHRQFNGERIVFLNTVSWTTGDNQSINQDTDFIPFTNNDSKSITNLNVKHKTIKTSRR